MSWVRVYSVPIWKPFETGARMILTINHETVYRYGDAVNHSTQYLRLTPPSGEGQRVLEWKLDLPTPATTVEDAFGNILHVLTLDMPHSEIRIRATGIVETDNGERMSFSGGDPRPYLRSTKLTAMSPDMINFVEPYRADIISMEVIESLSHAVHAWMVFDEGANHAGGTAAEAFAAACGASQDAVHVFVACCRHLGAPARYINGYVYAPGACNNFMTSHAWAEVWLEDRWWSFDIVNRCRADAMHLKLAVGMDYMDACPVRGVRRGGCETMLAEVKVMPSQQGMSATQIAQMIEQQQQQQQ
jgi:transglutaminase-like putative cysteine protease